MMKSDMTWDHSIRAFVQQAGSAQPTPGGGSVAALVAALGASMTAMVANLSQGEKFASIQPQIAEALEQMSLLNTACEKLLHEDIASFDQYMNALKLPKQSEEQKLVRKQALHEAVIGAIQVPLSLIEVCRDGLLCTLSIAQDANSNVISDLGIGVILFEAAAQSAALTVEINLAALKEPTLKTSYSDKLSAFVDEIVELKGRSMEIVRSKVTA